MMKTIVITSAFLPGNLENYCKENSLQVIRLNNDIKSIFPKFILILKMIKDTLKCLGHLKEIRKADQIICVFFISVPILIFRKLGLINKNTTIIWAGFFLHNKKYFSIFKKIFTLLFTHKDKLIVYSEYERKLYSEELGLSPGALYYVPLVFNPGKSIYTDYTKRVEWEQLPEKYYFSGGYSHRDYATLIKVFENISHPLIICSSTLNDDVKGAKLPNNVIILNDVQKEDFSELIKRSEGCVILIKDDSGAAGQLFTLEAMYHKRIVISSSSSILKEMISNEANGFVVHNAEKEIPQIIKNLESDLFDKELIGKNAHETVINNYGRAKHNIMMDQVIR
ncbi:glycosyltransferase [Pararcticibacter amylolyticus]|uniref:Glycosyl transferase family 1 domain-containing protein n=1 Tax=Pararcticibacter amylolyticus TaxID=2173175 RepID=A0A2U2PBX8_9SPHI|nr:glycosyltransferase [Pararcticibacter amylolyticus]PWG78804.1 hypothetical protein DDR33_20480 [Pararcticibacter amylolyticus]